MLGNRAAKGLTVTLRDDVLRCVFYEVTFLFSIVGVGHPRYILRWTRGSKEVRERIIKAGLGELWMSSIRVIRWFVNINGRDKSLKIKQYVDSAKTLEREEERAKPVPSSPRVAKCPWDLSLGDQRKAKYVCFASYDEKGDSSGQPLKRAQVAPPRNSPAVSFPFYFYAASTAYLRACLHLLWTAGKGVRGTPDTNPDLYKYRICWAISVKGGAANEFGSSLEPALRIR